MPKQTFWNLSDEKKNSIMLSAKKEFSRVPFSQSSINQIIKDAQISRGSFYMYFEDKHDLLGYVLTSFQERLKTALLQQLAYTQGIVADTVLGVHDYFYHLYEDKENQDFVKHMMIYFQSSFEEDNSKCKDNQPLKQALFQLLPLIDVNQFSKKDDDTVKATLDIVFSVLKSVLVNTFMQNLSIQESRAQLVQYLKIIQFGYLAKEEER